MDEKRIKFILLTSTSGMKTYIKADTIVQLFEEGGKTFLYTINDNAPMEVKECMDVIVAKIGEAV